MNKRDTFIVFCVMLFIISLFALTFFGNANRFFTNAYQPAVEQYRKNNPQTSEEEETPSAQPQPPGFREADIEKSRGERFQAF